MSDRHVTELVESQGHGFMWVCSCGERGTIKKRHLAKRGGDIHAKYFNSKRRSGTHR